MEGTGDLQSHGRGGPAHRGGNGRAPAGALSFLGLALHCLTLASALLHPLVILKRLAALAESTLLICGRPFPRPP